MSDPEWAGRLKQVIAEDLSVQAGDIFGVSDKGLTEVRVTSATGGQKGSKLAVFLRTLADLLEGED